MHTSYGTSCNENTETNWKLLKRWRMFSIDFYNNLVIVCDARLFKLRMKQNLIKVILRVENYNGNRNKMKIQLFSSTVFFTKRLHKRHWRSTLQIWFANKYYVYYNQATMSRWLDNMRFINLDFPLKHIVVFGKTYAFSIKDCKVSAL